jgi:hypothetical protein
MLPPSRSLRLKISGPNIQLTPGRITASGTLRFWQLQPALLRSHIPVLTVPAHWWFARRPQVGCRGPVYRLGTQQRFLQLDCACISFKLMFRLWPKNNAHVPRLISPVADQQKAPGVQADHSFSP